MPIRPRSPSTRRLTREDWLMCGRDVNERAGGSGCGQGTNFRVHAPVELSFPMAKTIPKTLAQKLWDAHVVRHTRSGPDPSGYPAQGEPDLLFVDLHLVHEVTSPQAFEGLKIGGRHVRRPDLTLATMLHNVPT